MANIALVNQSKCLSLGTQNPSVLKNETELLLNSFTNKTPRLFSPYNGYNFFDQNIRKYMSVWVNKIKTQDMFMEYMYACVNGSMAGFSTVLTLTLKEIYFKAF